MRMLTTLGLGLLLLVHSHDLHAEVQRWRVGEQEHPWNVVPVTGRLNWGRGWACELVDEEDERGEITTWLTPIRLDSRRNLAYDLNVRYLQGEFGGLIPGRELQNPFMIVPSEYGFRMEGADPISGDHFSGLLQRVDYGKIVDGDWNTASGGVTFSHNREIVFPGVEYNNMHAGGVGINLMGFYHIDRVVFGPRPSLPSAAIAKYIILYGDHTSIDPNSEKILPKKILVPVMEGQGDPPLKDLRFDPPVLMGRLDIVSLDPQGVYVETAEAEVYGRGFPLDASYTSEIIDLGPARPRVRRYSRQLERFAETERGQAEAEFPELPGSAVNWGRVRWRGRRVGQGGEVRLQFRAGNSLDTHVYARRIGPDEVDTRGEDGRPLAAFSWLTLRQGQVPERLLRYNELGVDLGADGARGWTYWSAPFSFEDGLIDERVPAEEWDRFGAPLPLPSGMRYVQFRILFDSAQHSACQFDFLEFDYAPPLISGGVAAEIFPHRAPLGEETAFRYFLRPSFAPGESSGFNRVEIVVPSVDTWVETVKFDGLSWEEVRLAAAGAGDDPLAELALAEGQFAQYIVEDRQRGTARLQVKLPVLEARHFQAREHLEIGFRTRLFRGAEQFTSVVWNDEGGRPSIVQPVAEGDVVPEVDANSVRVVVDQIGQLPLQVQVSPPSFTPNGDGINDEVTFTFDVFLVLQPVEIELEIRDLAGRRVHAIRPGRFAARRVQVRWDGRNEQGALLPPGLYVYRVRTHADQAQGELTGTLSLVY